MTDFDSLIGHANALIKAQKDRIDLQQEMIDIFLLRWKLTNNDKSWMETQDPQPHNAIRWLVDVLSTSDPQWTIKIPEEAIHAKPKEDDALSQAIRHRMMGWAKNIGRQRESPEKLAERYENLLRYMFIQNDQRGERRLIRELLINCFNTDQCIAKCIDLRHVWKASGGLDKHKDDQRSPIIYKAISPTEIYYEFDDEGLATVLHTYARRYDEVKRAYPSGLLSDVATPIDYSGVEGDDNGYVLFREYWTRDEKAVWVEKRLSEEEKQDAEKNKDKVPGQVKIDLRPNGLGFIPFVIKTANGSSLIGAETLPTNYAGAKSNIFHRANLFLTAAATLTYRRLNPQYKRTGLAREKPAMKLDYTQSNVYDFEGAENLEEIKENLDEDLYKVMQIVLQKSDESTAPKALVGQTPGGVTAAAAFNLIIEGGKLILVPVQEAVRETYQELAKMTFDYLRVYSETQKDKSNKLSIWTAEGTKEIDPAKLPKWMDIQARIDAQMPKDLIAQWNMAVQAYGAHMIPLDYAWEVMGVKDKNAMRKSLDEEAAQMQQSPAGAGAKPPGLPAQALAPNVAAGLPVEQNPQVEGLAEGLVAAGEKQGQIPR